MGERGPLPNPNARRRNKRPPPRGAVAVKRPAMPKDLSVEAKKEWQRVVPILESMGVLTTLDRGALISYCNAYADEVELRDLMKRSPKLVRGQRGDLVRNPLWIMHKDAERILADLRRSLKLTPDSRLRGGIKHDIPEEEEPEQPAWITSIDERRRRLSGAP